MILKMMDRSSCMFAGDEESLFSPCLFGDESLFSPCFFGEGWWSDGTSSKECEGITNLRRAFVESDF